MGILRRSNYLPSSQELSLPWSLIVPKSAIHNKICHRTISETGQIVVDEAEIGNIDSEWFKNESQIEQRSQRREQNTGKSQELILRQDVILVDDGLATGLTMEVAIKS